jgi:hypothetical protein
MSRTTQQRREEKNKAFLPTGSSFVLMMRQCFSCTLGDNKSQSAEEFHYATRMNSFSLPNLLALAPASIFEKCLENQLYSLRNRIEPAS